MIKYIAAAIVIAFILYMCFKIFTSGADIQSSIDEKRKELEQQGLRCSVFLRHLAGTDLPIGAFCMIRCFPENIEVSSSNLKRIIEKNDIVDAFMTTSTELLKEENKDTQWAKDIVAAYHSDEFKEYLDKNNNGLWYVPEELFN